MIEFSETVRIATSVERVWRALTAPAEVVQWDSGVIEPIDAPADYPQPGQHVRWRYRYGPIPLILEDRPSEVVPNSILRSSITLAGSMTALSRYLSVRFGMIIGYMNNSHTAPTAIARKSTVMMPQARTTPLRQQRAARWACG